MISWSIFWFHHHPRERLLIYVNKNVLVQFFFSISSNEDWYRWRFHSHGGICTEVFLTLLCKCGTWNVSRISLQVIRRLRSSKHQSRQAKNGVRALMSHKLNAVLQIQAPREIKFWNIYSRHGLNFIEERPFWMTYSQPANRIRRSGVERLWGLGNWQISENFSDGFLSFASSRCLKQRIASS